MTDTVTPAEAAKLYYDAETSQPVVALTTDEGPFVAVQTDEDIQTNAQLSQ